MDTGVTAYFQLCCDELTMNPDVPIPVKIVFLSNKLPASLRQPNPDHSFSY